MMFIDELLIYALPRVLTRGFKNILNAFPQLKQETDDVIDELLIFPLPRSPAKAGDI